MKKTTKILALVLAVVMLVAAFAACGKPAAKPQASDVPADSPKTTTLVYGSGDYTRINPAIDEHGEINVLLFDGVTAHNAANEVVPGLGESWEYDEPSHTYTFKLRSDVKWHDGKPFTAEDVKFTIEAIMNPENESEIASNYEEVKEITVIDEHTISFTLTENNVAFPEYMSIGVLPKHLLEGENMQESDFFRFPIGTGPYKMSKWDEGQTITMVKNDDYFRGAPKIDSVVFKIVSDDNAKALQLKSGELHFAQLTPKDAQTFASIDGFTCYDMKTADYRGILYNFNNEYWQKNRDIIPAINYGIDREAMIKAVILGQGLVGYGPLQRNIYNNENVEHYDYNTAKAKEILESIGCTMGSDGFYTRNGEKLGFTISCSSGDQVRIDMAQIAAQQLNDIGIEVKVEVPAKIDWANQEAFLIGWGSPFDADDHTYKIFGTDKGSNYSAYSNTKVDEYLALARQTFDTKEREKNYDLFQEELANDPAYTFFCYIDANYVGVSSIKGISESTVLGHHGVGIFWNVYEWTMG